MIADPNEITDGMAPRSDGVRDRVLGYITRVLHSLPGALAAIANRKPGAGSDRERPFRHFARTAQGVGHSGVRVAPYFPRMTGLARMSPNRQWDKHQECTAVQRR